MTEAGRRRIDVSGDLHSRLDAESKRRNIPIRDLVEQAVTNMFDREAQAALSVRQQRERRHADRIEEQTVQLGELARRISALISQQTTDLPTALKNGFDAMKTTIRETGGTGHLRDMIADFEKRFTAKFDEERTALAGLISPIVDTVKEQGAAVGEQLDRIEKRQSGARKFVGMGVAFGVALLVFVGCVIIPDTPPTRWLSVRLLGATEAKDAAWTLAGDGRTQGPLMAETKGLLHDSQFRERYAQCVDESKRSQTSFTCRIRFPVLKDITP